MQSDEDAFTPVSFRQCLELLSKARFVRRRLVRFRVHGRDLPELRRDANEPWRETEDERAKKE